MNVTQYLWIIFDTDTQTINMKRKYYETEANSDEEIFSDVSDEESYIAMVDKLEQDYFKRVRQQSNAFTCDRCQKMFKTMQYLIKHKLSHSRIVTCDICAKNFTRTDNLKTHKRRVHGEIRQDSSSVINANNSCDICFKHFTTKSNLTRHKRKVHNQGNAKAKREWQCRHCLETFDDYSALFNHVEADHPLIPRQIGGRQAIPINRHEITASDQRQNVSEHINPSIIKENETNNQNEESALNNGVQRKTVHPTGAERYDMLVFLANRKSEIRNYLLSKLQRTRGIKWNLCIHVEMERDSADITQNTSPYFRSRTYLTLTNETFSEHDLNEALQKIHGSMEKFLREGSGWYVKRIIKLEISTVIYSPLTGSSYIPLPASLVNNRRTFLNIENNDNKCALWCILASLHPADTNAKNVELYKPFQQEVDMNNIEFPMTLHSFDKFENQNPAISVNVFGFESNEILPLRITKNTERLHHVNLLLLKQGELSHYCLIKDLNGFLSRSKSGNIKHYFCPYCLQSFINQTLLHNHLSYCSVNGAQKVVLPSEGEKILKFRDFYKTQKVAFVIYVDFECINRKLHTCMPNPELSHTTALTKLEVCSYAYKVQSINPNYCKPVRVYRGENASFKLIEELLKEQEEIEHILSQIEPMVLSDGDRAKAESATSCCICQGDFTLYDNVYNRPVYHHCHVTGLFIGKAHSHCNLQCRQTKQTCVVLHNLRNFDAHIICEAIGNFKDSKLTCIAQNTERYVSFSLGNLRFIDSYQFLPSSLDNLVNDLVKDGIEAFPHMLSEFTTKHQAEILTRKGVYPYEHMDSFERFKETCLPEKNAFYSQIKLEGISDEDYEHAKNVFRTLKLKDMGEYHDLYLKCDVLLLCDVFEAFRNVSMEIYGIDPAHCYTSPGLSWQSCLKMTKVSLELMTDIDQILFVEKGIRGGISQISNRYKRANNPLLDNYDSSEESSYLIYLDMNNLYGYAMIQKLPVGGFKFLSDTEIQCFDIMSVSAQADIGFILEVSLEYPESIHDSHNEYPLAPEQKFVRDEDLSPYAKQLWRKLHGKTEVEGITSRAKVEKLLTTLEDKDHYIVHYRNLQLYLDLGLRIKEIHRILEFRQEAWMKPYIDFNTEMRRKATSAFQKNFYKLMNVSVFGKTMENVRKHQNIELVHTERRLKKLSAKPTFKSTKIFSEDLVAVELTRAKVKLCKPSYCGMCILDLSKVAMYDFYYNFLKRKYSDRVQLQMTDTDSLLIFCQCEDLYNDLRDHTDLFDFSEYPRNHYLYSEKNKKTLGLMKDETNSSPIAEFVGLRSKMYSFVCGGKEEKRLKGVGKATVRNNIAFKHYKDVLFSESQKQSTMSVIRSHSHKLFCENISKTSLSAFDDKRYLINAVESYAYGHYKIKKT